MTSVPLILWNVSVKSLNLCLIALEKELLHPQKLFNFSNIKSRQAMRYFFFSYCIPFYLFVAKCFYVSYLSFSYFYFNLS
jgi:hypothetical protein